jgi:hypothetical protein
VPLGRVCVELTAAEAALDAVAGLLSCCLLFSGQGLSAALLQSGPEGRTLRLPLGLLALLRRRRSLLAVLGWQWRRLLEVLDLWGALGGCVEGLAFGLEDLLADLLVLGDDLRVELSAAALGALDQLDVRLLLVAGHLLGRLHLLAWALASLLRHLPLQQRIEVLVCL